MKLDILFVSAAAIGCMGCGSDAPSGSPDVSGDDGDGADGAPADRDGGHAEAQVTDSAGRIVLTGSFMGSVDFGNGPLTHAGSGDIFLAKLGP